jgi:hypothetical protein
MNEANQTVKLYRIQVRYNKRAIRGQAPTEFYVLVENDDQLDEMLRRYTKVAKRLDPRLVAAKGKGMPPGLAVFIDLREKQRNDL